jgi:nucleotide-binding universal stress UspA family protein
VAGIWSLFTFIGEDVMLSIKTILHPTDFSERSEYAFRLACSLARDYGARLIVLHVAAPPMAVGGEGMLMLTADTDLDLLRAKLDLIRPGDPKVLVEHLLYEGDIINYILQVVADEKCDLIVLGTHGRTGLTRLLMGSVAELVVRKSPCPVVTVKGPLTGKGLVEELSPKEAVAKV